jgi:hypothetical protein
MIGRSFGGGLVLALALAGMAQAQQFQQVQPHVRRDGTYVQPHFRTAPNGTRIDNWSTQGNVTPYTGQRGTEGALPPLPRLPSLPPIGGR